VVAGGVELLEVTRAANIRAKVTWHAAKGWRFMDDNLPSNRPVPVRSQAVTVALLDGNAVLSSTSEQTDADGFVTVPNNGAAGTLRVTDRFGNVTSLALP
jgi:hypothetical protein